jgi:hypothetical protein
VEPIYCVQVVEAAILRTGLCSVDYGYNGIPFAPCLREPLAGAVHFFPLIAVRGQIKATYKQFFSGHVIPILSPLKQP